MSMIGRNKRKKKQEEKNIASLDDDGAIVLCTMTKKADSRPEAKADTRTG